MPYGSGFVLSDPGQAMQMVSPYWTAVRLGRAEHWYRASGAFMTVFRYQDKLYRSDCRRRTSEATLKKQGWLSAAEFFAGDQEKEP
jgi:hypothetical protein